MMNSQMETNEKKIYDRYLSEYPSIIQGKIKDPDLILSCIKIFEYFEDYEKCKELNRILHIIQNSNRETGKF